MASKIGAYTTKEGKVYPTITLTGSGPKGDKFPLTMGLGKCKLVLEHLEDIRQFVQSAPRPTQGARPATTSSDDLVL